MPATEWEERAKANPIAPQVWCGILEESSQIRSAERLARATPQELAADEWGWLPSCDRAWANLVQAHLAPHGYRMQAASLARLL